MATQAAPANFAPFNGNAHADMSQVPMNVQASYLPSESAVAASTGTKKPARKNPTAAEKRCSMVQSVILNQDPFGLNRCECLLSMSNKDIAEHTAYVDFWIRRGKNFSLKSR